MNQLRRTLRRLILEMWSESDDPYKEYSSWEEEHEKIVKLMKLIKSGDVGSINQALELSEAMEYINSYTYNPEHHDGYSGKKIFHYYELVGPFHEDFLTTLISTQKYNSGGKYFDLTQPDDEVVVLMFPERIK